MKMAPFFLAVLVQYFGLLCATNSGPYYRATQCTGTPLDIDCRGKGEERIQVVDVALGHFASDVVCGVVEPVTQRGADYDAPSEAKLCHAHVTEALCRVCGRNARCTIPTGILTLSDCSQLYSTAYVTFTCSQENNMPQCISRCEGEDFTSIPLCNAGTSINIQRALFGEESGNPLQECNCCARIDDCIAPVSSTKFSVIGRQCNGRQTCLQLSADIPNQAAPCQEFLSELDYLTIYFECVPAATESTRRSTTTAPSTRPVPTSRALLPTTPTTTTSNGQMNGSSVSVFGGPTSHPTTLGLGLGLGLVLPLVFLVPVVVVVVLYRRRRKGPTTHFALERNGAPTSSQKVPETRQYVNYDVCTGRKGLDGPPAVAGSAAPTENFYHASPKAPAPDPTHYDTIVPSCCNIESAYIHTTAFQSNDLRSPPADSKHYDTPRKHDVPAPHQSAYTQPTPAPNKPVSCEHPDRRSLPQVPDAPRTAKLGNDKETPTCFHPQKQAACLDLVVEPGGPADPQGSKEHIYDNPT